MNFGMFVLSVLGFLVLVGISWLMVVWMNVYFFVLKKVGLYGVCLVLVDVVDVLLVVVVDGDDECRL